MTTEQPLLPCREAFEKWYTDGNPACPSVKRSGDIYRLMQAQQAWLAWQAAWNTRRARPVPQEALDLLEQVKAASNSCCLQEKGYEKLERAIALLKRDGGM